MVVGGKGGWQEERATGERTKEKEREERSREGEAVSSWMVVVVVSKPHAAVAAA